MQPSYRVLASHPGAAMLLRTWARGIRYETGRRATLNASLPNDPAANQVADDALAAALRIEAWLDVNPNPAVAVDTRRCSAKALEAIEAWIAGNPEDPHAQLVALLVHDTKEMA